MEATASESKRFYVGNLSSDITEAVVKATGESRTVEVPVVHESKEVVAEPEVGAGDVEAIAKARRRSPW